MAFSSILNLVCFKNILVNKVIMCTSFIHHTTEYSYLEIIKYYNLYSCMLSCLSLEAYDTKEHQKHIRIILCRIIKI